MFNEVKRILLGVNYASSAPNYVTFNYTSVWLTRNLLLILFLFSSSVLRLLLFEYFVLLLVSSLLFVVCSNIV